MLKIGTRKIDIRFIPLFGNGPGKQHRIIQRTDDMKIDIGIFIEIQCAIHVF